MHHHVGRNYESAVPSQENDRVIPAQPKLLMTKAIGRGFSRGFSPSRLCHAPRKRPSDTAVRAPYFNDEQH
jgi:hypothetical protein